MLFCCQSGATRAATAIPSALEESNLFHMLSQEIVQIFGRLSLKRCIRNVILDWINLKKIKKSD